ncbi:hypothetical protein LRH25_11760 [Ideonella azotifigens]|nr:hypothetical protein [Ideonella azotifigens]MCD2341019.1 hypothetical protein [Ideonella azotifigens]
MVPAQADAAPLPSAEAGAPLAIVSLDNTSLRAGPKDSALQQAQLWQGDLLEVRGEKLDYLQVYDHRRERAGYVRASSVRRIGTTEADAPELLAVLRFVRDTPAAEALGVAYAAAYLQAVPAKQLKAEPFDALGTLAERLARRASARNAANTTDNKLAAHLEGVASYGVKIASFEQDGQVQLCYDGEAFRRVLAMPGATPAQRARAALALTREDCIDPALTATAREALDRWRGDVLNRLTPADWTALPEQTRNRLRMRSAGVWATLAFQQARRGDASQAAGQRALDTLAGVVKTELSDDDQLDYQEAAIRVGASRWAAEPPLPPIAVATANDRPQLSTKPGRTGETCVLLTDARHDATHPLLRRCSFGVAWLASTSISRDGKAATLAVQPLAGWRELWVMRSSADAEGGWTLDVLPPAAGNPLGSDLGYIEAAGWTAEPEPKLLVARETRTDNSAANTSTLGPRNIRRFEVTRLSNLEVDKSASSPQILAAFQRWQDPQWKRQSVSLR